MFIGANDLKRERRWRWISDDSKLVYSNWAGGEPNDSLRDEDCGQMYKDGSGLWNDGPCYRKHQYICEK